MTAPNAVDTAGHAVRTGMKSEADCGMRKLRREQHKRRLLMQDITI